jgi:RNase P subunit RPR2
MSIFGQLFGRVTYTCRQCGARQRIPLRRVHVFERFHELEAGEPVLIACPECEVGLQIPSAYRTHTGQHVIVDPKQPPRNAFIHANY